MERCILHGLPNGLDIYVIYSKSNFTTYTDSRITSDDISFSSTGDQVLAFQDSNYSFPNIASMKAAYLNSANYYQENLTPSSTYNGLVTGLASSTILPVELTQFNAKIFEDKVSLNWQTASELNNDYFQIEHSTNGSTFEKIGMVDGKGTTNLINYYDFTHQKPVNGINYYRLKQVDFDEVFEYSPVRAVNSKRDNKKISITPNPFSYKITLQLEKPFTKNTPFSIHDMMGRIVFTGTLEKDQLSKTLNLSKLQSGIFILHFGNGENTISQKIVKF